MIQGDTPIGRALRRARQKRGIKLMAVSRIVSSSTVHAIERGRMIPSVSVLDAITDGLGLSRGSLDMACLASSRDMRQRAELVDRIVHGNQVSRLRLQRLLRHIMLDHPVSSTRQIHTRFLLAKVLGEKGCVRRAVVILERVSGEPSLPKQTRVELLALLGRYYLLEGDAQKAVGPLSEAARSNVYSSAWESALCNLGLALWQIGAYESAASQWEHATQHVLEPTRLASAHMGLGNVAYRQNCLDRADAHYRKAHALYVGADANPRQMCKILNNRLKCSIRQGRWVEAVGIVSELASDLTDDAVTVGEFMATQAEWAYVIGFEDNAAALIATAKALLGASLVSSWFSVRIVELAVSTNAESRSAISKEIDGAIGRLNDRQLAIGIQLKMIRDMVHDNNRLGAEESLKGLAKLFPAID